MLLDENGRVQPSSASEKGSSRRRAPTYAAIYRAFGAFLGPDATSDHMTAEARPA